MRRLCLILLCAAAVSAADLRIGFVDPALPGETPRRNAAALAFARTRGAVTRLKPDGGGWRTDAGADTAPECFDLLWYHQGDGPEASLGDSAHADLLAYVQNGGTLLLSGCAGQLASELGLESTPPRVLGPTEAAYDSGIIVPPAQRAHPAFVGLDVTQPVVLTSLGGNALADFYGTAGPHGTLLAEGNAGLGERPLVEYNAGAGRVIFVGWRLPDFTTAADRFRPNLERLFANLLGYLAAENRNRVRLVVPPGKSRYARLCGVPFLRAETPVALQAEVGPGETAVWLGAEAGPGEAFAADGLFVHEGAPPAGPVLGLTVVAREHPARSWVAARRAEQAQQDAGDREKLAGLRVVKPQVTFGRGPLQPLSHPPLEQSVLLGRSAFMTGPPPKAPFYEPVEDGGFRITGGTRAFCRPIVRGQNKVWTGDLPRIRMETNTGNGTYAADRVYPLWPRADIQSGTAYPRLGDLRLAVRAADGTLQWLDERPGIVTTFRPGYTLWEVPGDGWRATVTVAPTLHGHGLICRVAFDRAVPLTWEFGGMRWSEAEPASNQVTVAGNTARVTDPSLRNGLSLCGWDGDGQGEAAGQVARFTTRTASSTYHVAAVWGVATHDEALARQYAARLDNPFTAAWPAARDRLKQLWYDTYVGPALNPEERLTGVLKDPAKALDESLAWWDARRGEFQIR
ncbi:MAG: hypothetical protein HYU66_26975, partial [Armatimonadetes bacterium]|nr:hypothetical protein [Armatimonadota bacterium]